MPTLRFAFLAFPYYRTYAAMAQFNEAAVLGAALAEAGAALEVIHVPDVSAGLREVAGVTDWSRYDGVLPLGCWGYHKDAGAFRAFITELESRGVRLVNPPEVVRWNLDKSYLIDLRDAGVEVASFLHFPAGSRPDLAAELVRAGWDRYVVKPTISANSERTRAAAGPPDRELLALVDDILGSSGLLVQPFFEEIPREGEWSLLFFDGVLSHSVIKKPRAGDFRSQPDHGGTVSEAVPPPAVVAQAEAALHAAPARCRYARVDGFVRDGRLHLVELELIEPYLFMSAVDPGAPARFAAALINEARAARA